MFDAWIVPIQEDVEEVVRVGVVRLPTCNMMSNGSPWLPACRTDTTGERATTLQTHLLQVELDDLRALRAVPELDV